MTYQIAKFTRDTLQAEHDKANEALKQFPRLDSGLTPDTIKKTPEWKNAKSTYDNAFSALRSFNAKFTKQYRKEIRAEKRA